MKLTGAGKTVVSEVMGKIGQVRDEIADIRSLINARTKGVGYELWLQKLNDLEAHYNNGVTKLRNFRDS